MEFTIGGLVKQLSLESLLESQVQDLADLMNRISHREKLMRSYLEADEQVETHTLEEFARSTVAQDSSSVSSLLSRINLLVAGSKDLPFRKPGVLELLLHATQVSWGKFVDGRSSDTACYVIEWRKRATEQVFDHMDRYVDCEIGFRLGEVAECGKNLERPGVT